MKKLENLERYEGGGAECTFISIGATIFSILGPFTAGAGYVLAGIGYVAAGICYAGGFEGSNGVPLGGSGAGCYDCPTLDNTAVY